MSVIKKLGSLTCRFLDFPIPVTTDFQLCKFDAFLIEDIGQPVDLTIQYCPDLKPLDSAKEVLGVLWMRYAWYIYRNEKGIYRWELKENQQSKETVAVFSMNSASDMQELDLWFNSNKITAGMVMEAFGHPFQYCYYGKGGLIFHCSLIEYHGKGILVAAPSGTGKTTFARQFRDEAEALILCGDRGYCMQGAGGWTAYGMPWCGTSGECINRKVPVHAVVVLEQAEENRLERLQELDAWMALYENLMLPSYDEQAVQCGMDQLDAFLEEIPVYHLGCTKGVEPVHLVMKELEL